MQEQKSNRLFWLGMHKVLKRTELPRLRGLGYEVFNPPYISPVYDQSADRRVDWDQPTTLPRDVFKSLINHDFFYTQVPPDIAELLNNYFDTIIVTINADWLKAILHGFNGRVIYRVYGQHFSLSSKIVEIELWQTVACRDNFTIVPFSAESVENEHRWFLERCSQPVPYQIPDDVFGATQSWHESEHRCEIATSIPNIQNPYFAAAYEEFRQEYPQAFFRIYGPQRDMPADGRIVGKLERQEFLRRLRESSGFYYNYKDSVCYLPPIEMMQLGGPVLCAAGSLLSRFYDIDAPGIVADPEDGETKLIRLLNNDSHFIAEVLQSQETVRRRYDRALVGPVFDTVFTDILRSKVPAPLKFAGATVKGRETPSQTGRKKIVIPLHVNGLFGHERGRAYAFEGIPRVVDVVIDVLVAQTELDVLVSCTSESVPVVSDFFITHMASGRLSLHVVDFRHERATEAAEALVFADADVARAKIEALRFVDVVNSDPSVVAVLVPHYYLFPEFLLCRRPLALYLPDYFPHLLPGVAFDTSFEKDAQNKKIGVAMANKAERILTNSEFTKAYLPDAGFVSEEAVDKIVVAPLPFLGGKRALPLDREENARLLDRVGLRPFLFYPTANRPNKQIAFLLRLFTRLRQTHPTLGLVLTCSLGSHPPAAQEAQRLGISDDLIFFPRASEGVLRWLYENSAALCLTSTLEGNFPPQVLEALGYKAPVVATRLPTITEILGEASEGLLLCRPLDLDDFAGKVTVAITARDEVLARQERVRERLKKWNSPELFSQRLKSVLQFASPAEANSCV